MAGSISDYLETSLISMLFNAGTFTPPSVWVGLSLADPLDSATGISEPISGAYARVEASASFWVTASVSGRIIYTSAAITFPEASAYWGCATNYILMDDSASGHLLAHGVIANERAIGIGDQFSFGAGNLIIGFNKAKMDFTAGAIEPDLGYEYSGATTGALATLLQIDLDSGSWSSGDAAGSLYFTDISGDFSAEDLHNESGSTLCTIDGALRYGISNYLVAELLDHVFGKGEFSASEVVHYIALSSGNPGADGSGLLEPGTADNYLRQSCSAWDTACAGAVANTNAIQYDAPSADWTSITWTAILDAQASGSGNMWFYDKLTIGRKPIIGDTLQFPAGGCNPSLT